MGGGLVKFGTPRLGCPPPPPIANVWLRHWLKLHLLSTSNLPKIVELPSLLTVTRSKINLRLNI